MPSATVYSWTEPVSGSSGHPRLGFTESDIPTLQSRKSGSHSSMWSTLASWCAGKRSQAYTYWQPYDAEYLGAFAFLYAVDNTYTTDADKAISVAISIAALSIPSDIYYIRRYALQMAMVFDWAYDRLTDTQRTTLRNRIWDYCNGPLYINSSNAEYLWGHSHGNVCTAAVALTAILGEGDTTQNTTWRNKMNEYLNHWDNGTNTCFLAGFRYFSYGEGGTHKGSAALGYPGSSESWYNWVVPTLERALQITPSWWSGEVWWTKMIWWHLWHWRTDRTIHKTEVEANELYDYSIYTQVHAAMIASRENNSLGEAAQWLYNEIDDLNNVSIWGPYHIFNLLWYDPTRTATRPTTAIVGTGYKHFVNTGHVCMRDGWDRTTDDSVVVKTPKYATGGHQMRREGSFAMCFRGSVFVRDSGLYNPSITTTYKDYDTAAQTGHRFTYAKRILAASVGRIFDSNEVAENTPMSFQLTYSSSSKFGVEQSDGSIVVSNDGGQLQPKGTVYQPGSLTDILAESAYQYNGLLTTPTESSKHVYVGTDLSDCYYASKCTKYHRHWLRIRPGSIPGWNYPILMVFDDLTVHSDTVGNKVYVYQLQVPVTPTGTAGDLTWTVGANKIWHKVLRPSSVSYTTISGYKDLDAVEYLPGKSLAGNDTDSTGSNAKRVEIWPSSTLTSIQFLALLIPAPSTVSSPPTIVAIDDGTWIGATINGVDCKVHVGSPYSGSVGSSSDTTPPATPGTPSGTAGSGYVDIDWADNSEGDLQDYDIYRSEQL